MQTKTAILCSLILALTTGAAFGQPDNERVAPSDEKDEAARGLFFTPRLIDLAVDRMTEDMASQYGFDDEQLWQTRELIKQQFPAWLEQHRDEIVVLANRFIEATISGEPPTKEQVAEFAERALPLINEFTGMIDQTTEQMRTYMTDDQKVMLDGEVAAFRVGVNYMQQRMEVWRGGGYDWQTEWPRSDEYREKERERVQALEQEQDAARLTAMGVDPASVTPDETGMTHRDDPRAADVRKNPKTSASPKDEMEKYTEDFIRRYKLDEAQQNTARKYLKREQDNRDRYLKRSKAEIDRVAEKYAVAKADEEKSSLREQLDKLQAPLDRYFQSLKDNLDKLPTREQKRVAAAAAPNATTSPGPKSEPSTDTAPKEKNPPAEGGQK